MIEYLGRKFNSRVKTFFYAMGFFFQILKETFFFIFKEKKVAFSVLKMQIFFTGFKTLSIVSFLSLAMGAIIIIQGVSILPRFGQGDLIYQILVIVITRELGPILTAFIITARSGTAIATELGNMMVNHQIEAYVSVGINPISYLVVPRFLGVTISLFLLTIYFNFIGLIASFFVAQFIKEISFMEYLNNLMEALSLGDVINSLLKSVVFGIIISTVATYHAFSVKVSVTEVPQVAIKAVGQGFVLCIVANVIITLTSYL